MATHSLVTMPVPSHSHRRKKCITAGCRSSARCASQSTSAFHTNDSSFIRSPSGPVGRQPRIVGERPVSAHAKCSADTGHFKPVLHPLPDRGEEAVGAVAVRPQAQVLTLHEL